MQVWFTVGLRARKKGGNLVANVAEILTADWLMSTSTHVRIFSRQLTNRAFDTLQPITLQSGQQSQT